MQVQGSAIESQAQSCALKFSIAAKESCQFDDASDANVQLTEIPLVQMLLHVQMATLSLDGLLPTRFRGAVKILAVPMDIDDIDGF